MCICVVCLMQVLRTEIRSSGRAQMLLSTEQSLQLLVVSFSTNCKQDQEEAEK